MNNIGINLDHFNRPKVYNESETIALDLFTLLMNRPGFFPSNPKLGMDIPRFLYNFTENVPPRVLKQELIRQCRYYENVIQGGDFQVAYIDNPDNSNCPILLFSIPTIVREEQKHLIFAMKRDQNDNIAYNYGWSNESFMN